MFARRILRLPVPSSRTPFTARVDAAVRHSANRRRWLIAQPEYVKSVTDRMEKFHFNQANYHENLDFGHSICQVIAAFPTAVAVVCGELRYAMFGYIAIQALAASKRTHTPLIGLHRRWQYQWRDLEKMAPESRAAEFERLRTEDKHV